MMFRQSYRSPTLIAVLLTAVVVPWLGGSAVAQDKAAETVVAEQPADGSEEAANAQAESSSDESKLSDGNSESTEVADAPRRMIDEQEAEKEKLRKSAMAGLLVLSLICIVFLVLIILVALWARRIRMLTRQPLPELHPGDPLWYLRKGKSSDSSDTAELTDSGSSHGES
jgi:hypothetical protein